MQNIIVKRYENVPEWQGWIEPEDLTWIMFVDREGHVTLFDERDPVTGSVL